MSRRREVLCPTPSKACYYDEDDARGAALRALAGIRRSRRQQDVFWIYACVCRRWHLSSHNGHGSIRVVEP